MQTYSQTFAASTTWKLEIAGSYYTTLACTNAVNVRLYKGGKQLDLGQINGLLAGLEVGPLQRAPDGAAAFDRVEIDVTGPDTVTVGIGNGDARYNRQNTGVAISSNKAPITSAAANATKTVTNASAQLIAANANRQYLLIQNNDATGNIFITFGAVAATTALGVKIEAGGTYEMAAVVSTQEIRAIGDIASNAHIVVVEG